MYFRTFFNIHEKIGVLSRNVFCYPRSKNKSLSETAEQTNNSEQLLCIRTYANIHPIL